MKIALSPIVAAMPWRSATAAVLLALAGAASAAPSISYTVVDLVDTMMGQDLQQYQYTLTGPIDTFGGVTIAFDSVLYGMLSNLTTSDPALDTTTAPVQPDAGMATDGLATVTSPIGILAGNDALFSIDFVWLGGARPPGSQPFDVFDGNGAPVFATSQLTTPAGGGGGAVVPEPGSLSLGAAALMAAFVARRGASQRR